MIIELYPSSNQDLIEMRDWIIENSPNSKLLIGFGLPTKWAYYTWKFINELNDLHTGDYEAYQWKVNMPDKDDIVYVKLVWG